MSDATVLPFPPEPPDWDLRALRIPEVCRYDHQDGECAGGLNHVEWPDSEVWYLCDRHADRNMHRMGSAHVTPLGDQRAPHHQGLP